MLLAIVVVGLSVLTFAFVGQKNITPANPQPGDIVIVANPTDLSKIAGISKFRSCFGHVYGFSSAFEGKEAQGSLKHYFVPKEIYLGTNNAVPVFAPFDGNIIYTEQGTDQFIIQQRPFDGWVFGFTHVIILSSLKQGSDVKAGQLVGYAALTKTHAFDIFLQTQKRPGFHNFDWYNGQDSIFNHMTSDVYVQYVAKGVTKENSIIPKAIRDTNPCPCDYSAPSPSGSPYCNFLPIPYNDQDNSVMLK